VLLKESNKNIETLDQVPGTQLASLWWFKNFICYWVNNLDTPNIHALYVSGTVENYFITGSRRTGHLQTSWLSVRKVLHTQVLSLLVR
jgi:hypothetical protein